MIDGGKVYIAQEEKERKKKTACAVFYKDNS